MYKILFLMYKILNRYLIKKLYGKHIPRSQTSLLSKYKLKPQWDYCYTFVRVGKIKDWPY